jgi:hypothetical protein
MNLYTSAGYQVMEENRSIRPGAVHDRRRYTNDTLLSIPLPAPHAGSQGVSLS